VVISSLSTLRSKQLIREKQSGIDGLPQLFTKLLAECTFNATEEIVTKLGNIIRGIGNTCFCIHIYIAKVQNLVLKGRDIDPPPPAKDVSGAAKCLQNPGMFCRRM
jgi:hypothetical protein